MQLGFPVVKRTVNFDSAAWPHVYFAVGDFGPGRVVTYFGYAARSMRRGNLGSGVTHPFAFSAKDDEIQTQYRKRLLSHRVRVNEVLERKYFKSIYFNDPDGHILEIATAGAGFLIDEPEERLGMSLQLPEWPEARRSEIERRLAPISAR